MAGVPAQLGWRRTRLRAFYAAAAVAVELSIVAKFPRLQSYYEELGYSVSTIERVSSLPFELLCMRKVLLTGGQLPALAHRS